LVLEIALKKYPKPEVFNTDQGSQYTSYIHTQTLKDNGITISMDSKGRATDNIAIERFWRSAKVERIYLNAYLSTHLPQWQKKQDYFKLNYKDKNMTAPCFFLLTQHSNFAKKCERQAP